MSQIPVRSDPSQLSSERKGTWPVSLRMAKPNGESGNGCYGADERDAGLGFGTVAA
jgi:hypothetical protein